MWIVIAVLWVIAPIPLLITLLVIISEKKKLRLENKLLTEEINRIKSSINSSPKQPEDYSGFTDKSSETKAEADSNFAEKAQASDMPYNIPKYNIPENVNLNHKQEQTFTNYENPVNCIQEKRVSKVSTINILFILGALFIIISGLIFATTTWGTLSSGVRAVIIFSFSALFFGASSLAERKFKLEKTGLLFYSLASVFLPITLIAAGYFKLFGEYFSLFGNGKYLLLALTFASLSAVCFKGSVDYADKGNSGKIYALTSLFSLSATVCMIILNFTSSKSIFSLAAAIYSFAALIICDKLSKSDSIRFKAIISQLNIFSVLNIVALSLSGIAACAYFKDAELAENALNTAACAIFAAGYLRGSFTDKNSFGGAIPFTFFIACSFISLISPKNYQDVTYTIAAITIVPTLLSFMNIIPEKLRYALKVISDIISVFALLMCFTAVFYVDVSWITLMAYAILSSEILILALRHKNEKGAQFMLAAFSAALVMLTILVSRLVAAGDTALICIISTAAFLLLQAIFVLFKKLGLRTIASDIIFAVSTAFMNILLTCTNVGISEDIYVLGTLIITSATFFIPLVTEVKSNTKTVFAFFGTLNFSLAVFPIYKIANGTFDILSSLSSNICIFSVFGFITAVSLALHFIMQKKSSYLKSIDTMIFSADILFCIFAYFYLLSEGSFSCVIPLAISAFVILRGRTKKLNAEYVIGLILLTISPCIAAFDIFHEISAFGAVSFAAITATAIYFVGEFSDGYFKSITLTVSRILLSLCTTVLMIFSITDFSETEFYYFAVIPFILLCCVQAYSARKTLSLIPIAFLLYPIAVNTIEVLCSTEGTDLALFLTTWIITALLIVVSYTLHRSKIINGKFIDVWAFSRLLGIFVFLAELNGSSENQYLMDTDLIHWSTIILCGLCILSLCRKEQKITTKKVFISMALFSIVIAWQTQKFFVLPEIISLEFLIVPVLIYFTAIQYLWKEYKNGVAVVAFAVYCIAYIVLFGAALYSRLLTDGLIIMISALVMLIFSFIVKKKKWFILSVAVLLVATLFMSRSFWQSVGWWFYLLAAGLILIAVGILNEIKKKSDKNAIAGKITRFMSEWTW